MSKDEKPIHRDKSTAPFLGVDKEPSDKNSDKLSDNIAKLETDLNSERDARGEERWYWIATCSLLIDTFIFNSVNHLFVFSLIFVVQIVMLIALARKWGVSWVIQPLELLFHKLTSTNRK